MDTIPIFIEGAKFSMMGLGAVWLASALIPRTLLWPQTTSPVAKFDSRKAITVFAICLAIGSSIVSTRNFITGINDLTQDDKSEALDLEALVK